MRASAPAHRWNDHAAHGARVPVVPNEKTEGLLEPSSLEPNITVDKKEETDWDDCAPQLREAEGSTVFFRSDYLDSRPQVARKYERRRRSVINNENAVRRSALSKKPIHCASDAVGRLRVGRHDGHNGRRDF